MSHSKNKKKEYFGYLRFKDSKQLVPEYPFIWFYADEDGGWSILKIKFDLHNLNFEGGCVPASSSAVKDAVSDYVKACKAQGAEINTTPTQPISYSQLIQKLKAIGVIDGDEEEEKVGPASNTESSILSDEHRKQVSDYVNKESKTDSTNTQPTPDALSWAVNEIYDPIDTTITIDGPEKHIDVRIDNGHVFGISPEVKETHGGTLEVMKTELIAAKATIARQDAEITKLRAKNLQLENHANRGQLTADLSQVMKATLTSGFKDLEMSLPDKVVKEMRADLTRQTDQIMGEICMTKTIKSVTEDTNSQISNIGESLSDIAGAMGKTRVQVKNIQEQLVSIGSQANKDGDSSPQLQMITQIRGQLGANSALLQEALKGTVDNKTPSKRTESSGALAPQKKCFDCGSTSHVRPCPDKLNFCARCLSREHKVYQCPRIRDICSLCRDANRGDFAYGHTRNVHNETDREKRGHIMTNLTSLCFPEWANSGSDRKRKWNVQ